MASIRERTDADGKTKWHVQVRLKNHPPQTQSFARKSDAKIWAEEIERSIRTGRFTTLNYAQKKTIAELFAVFKSDYMRKSRTKDYTQILDWWEAEIGKYLLIDVKAPVIQKLVSKLANTPVGKKKKKRAVSTTIRYLAVLSCAMTVAVENLEWLDRSPISGVKKPAAAHGKIPRVLSHVERGHLLQAVKASENKYLVDIVLIALRTGMRRSEIMKLRWNDFEWNQGHALIIVRETKNKKQRVVPLVRDAHQVIRDRYDLLAKGSVNDDLLFPGSNSDAKPVHFRTAWNTALRRAGIKNFRFHDLRHTAASRFASLGYSLAQIAEILGHVDLRSTQIYTHFAKGHTAEMA
jgi:integrase